MVSERLNYRKIIWFTYDAKKHEGQSDRLRII